jgi:predicted GIY-YIG superfamily endonuclease
MVYSEEHPDRSSAVKRENQIKRRKDREFIETLIGTSRP